MATSKEIRQNEPTLTTQNSTEIDTFIDYLWLEDGLAKNTLESYRLDLTTFALWLPTQNKHLLNVEDADIQQYLAVRFPLSKVRSINRWIATLRRFYRYLLRNQKINQDPTIQIRAAKNGAPPAR